MYPVYNVRKILRFGKSFLKSHNIDCYLLDAELLLVHAITRFKRREDIIVNDDFLLKEQEYICYVDHLNRRANGEPVAYIIGKKDFWRLTFMVTQAVLVPRPDTETLIETVINCHPNKGEALDILDLGTGSGCIIVSLLDHYINAKGLATDICPAALNIARRNAITHNVRARVDLVTSDWFFNIKARSFDIIVANPPYIAFADWQHLSHKDFEPKIALTDSNDGLIHYRQIANDLSTYLKPDGVAIFEFGIGQSELISAIFTAAGFKTKAIIKDLQNISRCIAVCK